MSGRLIVVAPASITASTTRQRKSGSLRVASSAENSTSSVNAARARDGRDRGLEAGLARHPELDRQVQVRRGDERVDPAAACRWPATRRAVDVRRRAARERGDDGTLDGFADPPDRLGVGLRGDGEAGFDDVHAERLELPGQPDLLLDVASRSPGACSPSRRVVSKMTSRSAIGRQCLPARIQKSKL